MSFNKVSQEKITKAKNDGNLELYEKLSSKYVKQHKTSRCKQFYNWLVKHSAIINIFLSITTVVITLITLIVTIIK